MAHWYEMIHITPPISYHWHLSICLTLAWRSKEMEITEFHTADWTYSWFWYYSLKVMDQPPYIPRFTPSDCHLFRLCMKYLAGKRFAMCWHETSCHLLGPDACHRFLLGCVPALLTWWDKHLSVCGDYMEVWCAPFATHLPCIHEVKMMFLATECLSFFWNSWVGYRKTTTATHYHNLSLFV